jgi:hypothetical protein
MSFGFVVVVDHTQLSPDSRIICCVNSLCCYHYVSFSFKKNFSSLVLSGCQFTVNVVYLCCLFCAVYFAAWFIVCSMASEMCRCVKLIWLSFPRDYHEDRWCMFLWVTATDLQTTCCRVTRHLILNIGCSDNLKSSHNSLCLISARPHDTEIVLNWNIYTVVLCRKSSWDVFSVTFCMPSIFPHSCYKSCISIRT